MDQGSMDSEGEDLNEQGSSPMRHLTIPFVEDINLSHAQFLGILSELKIPLHQRDPVLVDKIFQILTCNQSKLLRSHNLFNFLLVVQDNIALFEEVQKPDVNIEEECDFGGFTTQGRFVFFLPRQFEMVRQEFREF